MSAVPEWQGFRARLESLMAEVVAEIRNYPPPIPACDAQFNHLLELRAALPGELSRLENAAGEVADIAAFIAASPCRDELARLWPNAADGKSPSPAKWEREGPVPSGTGG